MLNYMVLQNIHSALESYDRKYTKCQQITKVREEKHYKRKEIIDIYFKLAAKYNRRTDKSKSFESFICEYKDKLDKL